MLSLRHESHTVNFPPAQRYLHCRVDSRVCSQAEVCAGDVVADGGRDYTHGDTELFVAAPGFKQVKHTCVSLLNVKQDCKQH